MAIYTAAARTPRQHAFRARPLLTRLFAALMLFSVTLAGAQALQGARGAAAPSSSESELMSIHSALDDLHQQFFRPVTDAEVLLAAWSAAVDTAQKKGVDTAAIAAPDLTHGRALIEFDRAYRALDRAASAKLGPLELGRAAIVGAAGSVHENHTYYLGPEHWVQRNDTSVQYAGIGVTLSQKDGAFYIGEVYQGSPADSAGLRPGDRITEVAGAGTGDMTMEQLVARMRGAPKTEVVVTVRRSTGLLQAALTRQIVVVPSFETRVLEGGVGYLKLRSFPPVDAKLPDGKTVPEAFVAALGDFDRQGVTSWVLDLRGNGGGYLNTLNAIANALLPSGTSYFLSQTQHGDQVSKTSGGQHLPARPLTVLVDGGSASASEILTVALQESGRADVVGLKSAGVANAADLDSLPDGGGLSVTAVRTLTPVKRRPLDGQGVFPDVSVELDSADIPLGHDRQLDTAAGLSRLAASIAAPRTPVVQVPVSAVP